MEKGPTRSKKKSKNSAKKAVRSRAIVSATAASPNFNPVLSAIVTGVDGSGAEAMSFTAEIPGLSPKVSFGEGVSRRWLCSNYYSSGGAEVTITAHEYDPTSDDTFDDETEDVGEPSPASVTSPTQGSVDIEVDMNSEDAEDESASYTVAIEWYASPSVLDVIDYMLATASGALGVDSLQNAKQFNEKIAYDFQRGDVFTIVALGLLDPIPELRNPMDSLIDEARSWTLGASIQNAYGSVASDKDRGLLYDSEVWEPVAFGYVGAACSFTQTGLLEGFGVWKAEDQGVSLDAIASALRSGQARNYASDSEQAAVAVGYALWNDNGADVSHDDVLKKLRSSVSRFKTEEAAEGVPPVSFRNT